MFGVLEIKDPSPANSHNLQSTTHGLRTPCFLGGWGSHLKEDTFLELCTWTRTPEQKKFISAQFFSSKTVPVAALDQAKL